MERKNITIREDQAEWIAESSVNLSKLVQDAIDEQLGPTEEDLAAAYQDNASHASETNETWQAASSEATQQLGSTPDDE